MRARFRYIAAYYGHEEVVRLLTEHGLPPDLPNKTGFTPLMPAAQEGAHMRATAPRIDFTKAIASPSLLALHGNPGKK